MSKGSNESVTVATWLVVVTQHKPLVDALSKLGNQQQAYLSQLASCAMELLVEKKANDSRALVRADAFVKHAAAGFVLDAFALVATEAGISARLAMEAIARLADMYGFPLGGSNVLTVRSQRALKALKDLQRTGKLADRVGDNLIQDFLETNTARQALRVTRVNHETFKDQCVALVSKNLYGHLFGDN